MARWILRGGLIVIVGLGGCAVKASTKVQSSTPASEDAPNAWESTTTSGPSASATPAPTATSSDNTPVAPMPGCSLVCNVANVAYRHRVQPADEARLTQGLADVTQALHQCVAGRVPSLTLRFDSGARLTGFGVDADHYSMGADACIDSVNQRMPAVSYPGPSTLRCYEHCRR